MPSSVAVTVDVLHDSGRTPAAGERAAVGADVLAALNVKSGRQIRVTSAQNTALFTAIAHKDVKGERVGVSPSGLSRLGLHVGQAPVTLSAYCVHPTMSPDQAERVGELVESVRDNETPTSRSLLVLAPHGGAIERWTDEQALQVCAAANAQAWICQGWRPGGGAYASWHISSNALHPDSFALLKSLAAQRFETAVAFHGYRGESILIGGSAPHALKRTLRDAITDAVADPRIDVQVADPRDIRSGTRPTNIVNRMADNGIQLEQSLRARRHHRKVIAEAVSAVLA